MSLEQTKAQVTARIWQSIAQSGVSLTAIPKEQLETLVNAISDGVLLAVDELLEGAGLPGQGFAATAASATPSAAGTAGPEEILWQGRPFLSISTYYVITNERVRIIRGLLAQDRDDIELIRIQDIDHTQGIGERMLGIGDVILRSADPSLPEVALRNVSNPEQVHEILRRAMLDARKRMRYSVQEEM